MSPTGRPSLRRVSLFAATWWSSVLVGWLLLAVAIVQMLHAPLESVATPMGMIFLLLVILELRPLVMGQGHDPQGVTMSTAFVLATLFLWGPWPAIVAVSLATLLSGLRARKAPWKALFNIGQYNVCIWLTSGVLFLARQHPSIRHPETAVHARDIVWIVAAWVVYYVLNNVQVSAVLAYTESFRAVFMDDIVHATATTFSVMALSPLIVVVALGSWAVLPFLLIPLLLVYRMAQMSLEREHQANHDALTGLPNRHGLQSTLDEAIGNAAREQGSFGLLLIDMDHFKEVNDTLGHQVGDTLLVHFAERLTGSIRPDDVVARLGGDEFAVVVPDADEKQTRAVAERIQASLAESVALQGMSLEIEASIGIASYPVHGTEADDLMRLADVAMYAAKQSRTGVASYSAAYDRHSVEKLPMISELRRALEHGGLQLHYQPKVSLADRRLMGVEALLRWDHPERGFVPPDEFIPLAERSGIMPRLTEHVVTMALEQMAQWRSIGQDVCVAVNVSLTDLTSGQLSSVVQSGLRRYGIPAGMLQLEITERVVAEDSPELNAILAELDELGVTLSLDDFGTGYSSLVRLKNLTVDELKIDRGFVSGMDSDSASLGIVRAVVDLAHALGMPAIAEGVETAEEFDALRDLGCDGAQGWFISRPMPADKATQWLVAQDTLPVGS